MNTRIFGYDRTEIEISDNHYAQTQYPNSIYIASKEPGRTATVLLSPNQALSLAKILKVFYETPPTMPSEIPVPKKTPWDIQP